MLCIWRKIIFSANIILWKSPSKFVGNNAKGQISKRVFQENKARPIFTHTYVSVSRGKKYSFFGKFGVLYFLGIPVLRLALLPHFMTAWSDFENSLTRKFVTDYYFFNYWVINSIASSTKKSNVKSWVINI